MGERQDIDLVAFRFQAAYQLAIIKIAAGNQIERTIDHKGDAHFQSPGLNLTD